MQAQFNSFKSVLFAEKYDSGRSARTAYLKENGNLSMPENLVMTSAYTRTYVQTMGEGVERLSRVGKGVLDMHVAFRFRAN